MKKNFLYLILFFTAIGVSENSFGKCAGIALHSYAYPTYPPLSQTIFLHNDTIYLNEGDSAVIYAQYDGNCHFLLGDVLNWYRNDTLITTSSSYTFDGNWFYAQKFTVKKAGKYHAAATTFPNSSSVNDLVVIYNNSSATGTINLSEGAENFSVYPNPSDGVFNLQFTNYDEQFEGEMEIYNITGAKILQLAITSNLMTVDLSDKPKGIYFYTIISEGKIISGKILVE